jgi:hypothetical protein
MANWYLLNDTQYGVYLLRAGKLINDAIYSTPKIQANGGVLWPAADPYIAAAAANITFMKRRGVPSDILAPLMLAAAEAATNGSALGGSTTNIYGTVQKATTTITFAALTAAATTQTLSPNGAATGITGSLLLPANSRVIGREINGTVGFTGGALSAMTIGVGGVSSIDIVSSQSVFTAVGLVAGTSGTNPQPLYAAATQVTVLFTATSANVNAATAGSVTIDVLYLVLP